ncbi:MAG: c-type cytochrome [Chloroflexi bacterium]|nr:c-type cytochrome [Chloroflexota bacterium]
MNGRRRLPFLGIALGLVVLIVGVGGGAAFLKGRLSSDDVSASAVVKRGQSLYKQECLSCHGATGERLPVVPLNSKEFLDTRGDATLMAVVSDGKGVMPAFGKPRGGPFSDQDTLAVVAYLNNKAGRPSYILQAGAGKVVYQQTCARCHGPNGDRIPIAPLNAKGFLDEKTDQTLGLVIRSGKGVMPPQSKEGGGTLDGPDIEAVVGYLRNSVQERTVVLSGRGRELYLGNCLQCHGEKGDRVPTTPLASGAYLSSLSDGDILTAINEGKGVMPAFGTGAGGTMGVPDIAALLTYLKTSSGLNSTSALASAGAPGTGRELFLRNCTACHGQSGDKVPGIKLLSKEFLARETDAVLLDTITRGNAKGMPAWGQKAGGSLTEQQVGTILEFLKSTAQSEAVTNPGPGQAIPGGGVAPAPVEVSVTAATVAKGKEIFMGTCIMCHGETRDKVPTCKLYDGDWLKSKGDATLIQSVTLGKGPMPAWGNVKGGPLSQDDVKSVVAFLKNAAGIAPIQEGSEAPAPATGSGSDTAALAAKGKELFMGTCIMCHGETRDKVPTCKLADKGWLEAKTFDGVVSAITNGKPPMMPTWGKSKGGTLSDDEIKAVATFLWTEAGLSAGGGAPAAAAGPAISAEAVAKGKATFMGTCIMCHGETRDKVPTCKLADAGWLKAKTFDGVVSAITNGKPPMMPTWGKSKGGTLSDEEIKNVASFLWTEAGLATAGAAAPAPGPVLTAEAVAKGKARFMGTCIMCHGETRDKVPTCKLADADWLKAKTFQGVVTAITNGKPPMMPTWGKSKGGTLSDEEIQEVAAFLWTEAGLGKVGEAVASAVIKEPAAAPAPAAPPVPARPFTVSAESGKDIYMSTCVFCHGQDGFGKRPCPLGSREWLSNMSEEGLMTRIRNGKPSVGMPTWGKAYGGPLSDDQIKAVTLFLWQNAR